MASNVNLACLKSPSKTGDFHNLCIYLTKIDLLFSVRSPPSLALYIGQLRDIYDAESRVECRGAMEASSSFD